MSSEATTWAMRQNVGDPCRKLVLLGLANNASKTGEHAFPGVKTLAEDAECSTRSVQRHLKLLVEAGLIVEGDQRYVSHIRADRRPTVYDLAMSRGDNLTPRTELRGDTEGGHGVTNGDFAPHIETNETARREPDPVSEWFSEWYAEYPRKRDVRGAEKSYRSALKAMRDGRGETLTPEQARDKLLVRVKRYAKLCAGRDPQYVKYPASWLNRGAYDDEDLLPANWKNGEPRNGVSYDAPEPTYV